MIELYNFDEYTPSGISYGGHSGSKKGIIIDNEKWFLKFPKSTKSMNIEGLSYSTSPLSEYIGSKVYESLDINVHETRLGISNGKCVVAVKDFLDKNEIILDYNAIKNEYNELFDKELEDLSERIDLHNSIEEVILLMDLNSYFEKIPKLKTRFWKMFLIDAFIGNHDRNEGNWGLILNRETKELKIPPVFDNGASFYTNSSNERLLKIINDKVKFKQSVYDSALSVYRENEKRINPLKFIESMRFKDLNEIIKEIVPKINMEKIKEIIYSIPNSYQEVKIISDIQKEFYYKTLFYRYEFVLKPVYNKLK